MKPRVVSKKAQAKTNVREKQTGWIGLQAQPVFDGVADTKPATVTGISGSAVNLAGIIAKVESFYPLGYNARSRAPAGFRVDATDGGFGGNGTAQKQAYTGGSLSIQGTFTGNHTGKKGKLLGAVGYGYVVSSVGGFTFGGVWNAGTPVTMRLGGDGRNWIIAAAAG